MYNHNVIGLLRFEFEIGMKSNKMSNNDVKTSDFKYTNEPTEDRCTVHNTHKISGYTAVRYAKKEIDDFVGQLQFSTFREIRYNNRFQVAH